MDELIRTHIENSSGPLIDKKLTLLSVASALAIIVFEQPGGPNMSIPLGGAIPMRVNASGCRSGHSIACFNCNFSSSWPPMSDHLTS